MRILVSNDDGYFAPGLSALADAMAAFGEVDVYAPERDRSGASNSLTLDRPLSVRQAANGFHFLNGTPTDCVHVAIHGLLAQAPELVVSGINDGANMGEDTLYSGTVAAAMEGYLHGLPAIAFSLTSRSTEHLSSAARIAAEVVAQWAPKLREQSMMLNVNIPSLPYERIKGFRLTRLGRRHPSEGVIESLNPKGQKVYWIGLSGKARDAGPETDFHAIEEGFVSITPLDIDLTARDLLGRLRKGAH